MSHTRPTRARITSPIWVRFDVDYRGRRGYRWTCDQHAKAKGFHHNQRWRPFAKRGEPDTPAFDRCMTGATLHWHRYHAPAHACCLVRAADGGPAIVPVAKPPSQPAMPPTLTAADHCPH
jgi:hypothetical protein